MVIEEKTSLFEGAFGIGGILIAIIATFSSPKLDSTISREELVRQRDRKVTQIAELQGQIVELTIANEELQTRASVLATQLRRTDGDLEALQGKLDEANANLGTVQSQVVARDAKIAEMQDQLAQFEELLSVQEVAEERDAAMQRASEAEELIKEREDRIRELTLQLHRANGNR